MKHLMTQYSHFLCRHGNRMCCLPLREGSSSGGWQILCVRVKSCFFVSRKNKRMYNYVVMCNWFYTGLQTSCEEQKHVCMRTYKRMQVYLKLYGNNKWNDWRCCAYVKARFTANTVLSVHGGLNKDYFVVEWMKNTDLCVHTGAETHLHRVYVSLMSDDETVVKFFLLPGGFFLGSVQLL